MYLDPWAITGCRRQQFWSRPVPHGAIGL